MSRETRVENALATRRSRFAASIVAPALAAALVVATLVAAGCTPAVQTQLEPPAQAVDELLTLRAERSTDASAYAEYLREPALAEDLARAATEETSTQRPTPEWEDPYVSDPTSNTADVVVIWKDRTDYPDWPAANIFLMELFEGRWVVNDADVVTDTATLPPRP